jgi:hypothetical protein
MICPDKSKLKKLPQNFKKITINLKNKIPVSPASMPAKPKCFLSKKYANLTEEYL